MAKRRGIFRSLVQAVRNIVRPSPRVSPPSPPPSPPSRPPSPPTPSRQSLRNRAANHIVSLMPLANIDRVRDRMRQLDDDELRWTVRASADQLRWRARQDADRVTPVDMIPLNPWWYH